MLLKSMVAAEVRCLLRAARCLQHVLCALVCGCAVHSGALGPAYPAGWLPQQSRAPSAHITCLSPHPTQPDKKIKEKTTRAVKAPPA